MTAPDLHTTEMAMERLGHEIRAEVDPVYKRATWGLRPEDIADQQALIGEMGGPR